MFIICPALCSLLYQSGYGYSVHNRSIIVHFRPFLGILHYNLWKNVIF